MKRKGWSREPYTTLVALKQTLGSGLPPFVPLTLEASEVLDTPGMGVIEAHPKSGALLCPIKGCGRYFHHLAAHLSYTHREMGGAFRVRELLGFSARTAMCSVKAHEKYVDNGHGNNSHGQPPHGRKQRSRTGAGYLNMRDRCLAQLKLKWDNACGQLGKEPSSVDWHRLYGFKFTRGSALFHSWRSFAEAMHQRNVLA